MRVCGESGLNLFHRVIIQGGSALDASTLVRQPRSYALSLAARLNCSVDDDATTPPPPPPSSSSSPRQPRGRRRLVDCLKRAGVRELVAAGAAVSADAPRFLAAFGPSVDDRTVQDVRRRMSDLGGGGDGRRRRSALANVSLLVGLTVGDGLSRLTATELADLGEAKLNRKRRTLVRTFVQNLFTFHRQTIADILLHQVHPASRQWCSYGVGRVSKVQGPPSAGIPELETKKIKIIFPLQRSLGHLDIKH